MQIRAQIELDHEYEDGLYELLSALKEISCNVGEDIAFQLEDGSQIEFVRIEYAHDGTDENPDAKRVVICRLLEKKKPPKAKKAAKKQ